MGQEEGDTRYVELDTWVLERFTKSGSVDYRQPGQILNSIDLVSFIGLNQGMSHTYVVTVDTGHGLILGILAGKVIADRSEVSTIRGPNFKP